MEGKKLIYSSAIKKKKERKKNKEDIHKIKILFKRRSDLRDEPAREFEISSTRKF